MSPTLAHLTARPVLAALAGGGLLLALAVGPVLDAWETADRIAASRDALVRACEAAARPPVPVPLVGNGADALLGAFRGRLDALVAERAAVIDRAELEADPARPALPRLRASLRGTADALQGLLDALETQAPLVAVEEAEIRVERPADPDLERPTGLRLALTVRGVLLPEPGSTAPGGTP
ncbi:GspMb/PilO family protein [Methylobacterium sp. WL12]|uniref:GspMb/PilO family protein n=1 Tax=Methylobacterium sp. WL12 TaxID=2603890 RepID=UPI001650CB6D|nr:GspMb/PilO family protein [Methylobacterium sp. WL12]